jgi:MraZ protein
MRKVRPQNELCFCRILKLFFKNPCQLFENVVNMWEKVGKVMDTFFFNGSEEAKLDEKGRFVLPQNMRYGLVENGRLEFTIALGLGGCLAIYKRSDIEKIVKKFQDNQHIAKFQKFFTLFFSTLHNTTCDKVGRITLPAQLKKAVGINKDVVIAGVLNKIEIWPKDVYDRNLQAMLEGKDPDINLSKMIEEAFALLNEKPVSEPQI